MIRLRTALVSAAFADTEAVFDYYDHNGDGLICVQAHPKQGPDAFNSVYNNVHVRG